VGVHGPWVMHQRAPHVAELQLAVLETHGIVGAGGADHQRGADTETLGDGIGDVHDARAPVLVVVPDGVHAQVRVIVRGGVEAVADRAATGGGIVHEGGPRYGVHRAIPEIEDQFGPVRGGVEAGVVVDLDPVRGT